MRFKNPIPKELRENKKELELIKSILIKKGIFTDAEYKNEKSKK